MVNIVAFAGSTRKASFNKKMVAVAAKAAEKAGAKVTIVDLADFPMPLFCEDLEAEKGMPEFAQKFKDILLQADGFLIACPEYNSTYSAVLKNAIDWTSRVQGDEQPLQAFRGKMAGIMATSPGGLGGMRVLVPLRMLLENIAVMVLPNQVALPAAHEQFDEAGEMVDDARRTSVEAIGVELVETLNKLK